MRADTILLAVSRGFDIIEGEIAGVASGHSARVAALCNSMGSALGIAGDDLITLTACALFHDSALTEWLVTGNGDEGKHCVMGQHNIDTLPLPTNADGIVLYHHERADGSGPFGLQEVPLSAEIISLADAYDAGRGLTGYSPRILAAFDGSISDAPLAEWHLMPRDAMKLGGLIAKAIDYKSTFTRRHTLGIAEKAAHMAAFYGYDEEETAKLYIAACLHDLGKLATPSAVLEKPGKLTGDEFTLIKDHVSHTYELLAGVDEDIRRWAAGHHEKLDGTGYPFGQKADELDFNTRLMACVDIYQAVSEERPYHPARTHAQTMPILYEMAGAGLVDERIVKDLDLTLEGLL